MTEECTEYLTLQVTEYEFYKLKKIIDDYNRNREACRMRKVAKHQRYKEKSDVFAYPRVLDRTKVLRLKLNPDTGPPSSAEMESV